MHKNIFGLFSDQYNQCIFNVPKYFVVRNISTIVLTTSLHSIYRSCPHATISMLSSPHEIFSNLWSSVDHLQPSTEHLLLLYRPYICLRGPSSCLHRPCSVIYRLSSGLNRPYSGVHKPITDLLISCLYDQISSPGSPYASYFLGVTTGDIHISTYHL